MLAMIMYKETLTDAFWTRRSVFANLAATSGEELMKSS
jgi:hypothetical protein